MKAKQTFGTCGLLLAAALWSQPRAAAEEWVAIDGSLPGWMLETLRVEFPEGERGPLVRYALDVPDPCHRLVHVGEVVYAESLIACDLRFERLEGGACPEVITPYAARIELGELEVGDYTLKLRHGRRVIGTYRFSVGSPLDRADKEGAPVISGIAIEAGELAIDVAVPSGVKKVTLQSRVRLGRGAWVSRAVRHTRGEGGEFTFRLSPGAKGEILRVRGDHEELLPASFYEGETRFNGEQSEYNDWKWANGPVFALDGARDAEGGGEAPPREVVESDIWMIDHDRDLLYFFNQYRGLQKIDISDPNAPSVLGTLALAAAGEQMYLIDDRYALLLARDSCGGGSQAIVVDVSENEPMIAATAEIEGNIQESRLVGSVLYVVSQAYREGVPSEPVEPEEPVDPDDSDSREDAVPAAIETGTTGYGSIVSSLDLADPTNPTKPEENGELWFPGSGHVISATDRYLFAVVQSVVHVIDISSPTGEMALTSRIRPAGTIRDKFKMNLAGDIFTMISERSERIDRRWFRVTVLETYSLKDPTAPRFLDSIEVGQNESLFATRFDGERAYIVTFLRVDPLWVIDLSDPEHLSIVKELEVPGFSNYIHPLGDRLVTVGVGGENNRQVAVSLYDVSELTDPDDPRIRQVSSIVIGDGNTWSEANYDEKAFTVLPNEGLILVPFSGWSVEDGRASSVQIIQFTEDSLVAKGVIDHAMQPRRATVHAGSIISISGRELMIVDATNLDDPVVMSELELSWSVDRVLLAGDYVIEVSQGGAWQGAPVPELRVVLKSDLDEVVARATLDEATRVIGATVRRRNLYVVQSAAPVEIWPVPEAEGDEKPDGPEPKPNLILSVYDLSGLPDLSTQPGELRELARVEAVVADLMWSSNLEPLWLSDTLLVWSGGVPNYYWWGGPVDFMPIRGGLDMRWWPYPSGTGSGRFFTYDLSEAGAPELVSDLNLAGQDDVYDFSEAFAVDSLVYLSHRRSTFIENPEQPEPPLGGDDPKEFWPRGYWHTTHNLEVVDFADSASPTRLTDPKDPVELPGRLIGVTHQGALLYTTGPRYDENGRTDWKEFLHVCAYDVDKAPLITSMALPESWPRTLLVTKEHVLIGSANEKTAPAGKVETFRLTDDGKLGRVGAIGLEQAANTLKTFQDDLLAVQAGQTVELFDASDPATLFGLGGGTLRGCMWPALHYADGTQLDGLWIPLGGYGVAAVLPKTP